MSPPPQVFYTPSYDISLFGVERLHPFDGSKPTRAWKLARTQLGSKLDAHRAGPSAAADEGLLKVVHTAQHLQALKSSRTIAKALEVGPLRLLPASILDKHVLLPMRWAVSGTLEAAKAALSHGCAINLAGGYHHAHADHGEGFCIYADVPIAIESLRRAHLLKEDDRVAIIDLDAHRGNGFEAIYRDDRRISFLDIYNFQVYPGGLNRERVRFPLLRPLRGLADDEGYCNVLEQLMCELLEQGPFALAFFNAGTDVLGGDPLGGFGLSRQGVLCRDQFVLQSLDRRGIPWVMVPSGGYTDDSHRLLAETIIWSFGGRERAAGKA